MKIALIGAESTGKTALAAALAAQLRKEGRTVVVVDEVLRHWCTREQRTPRPEEQMAIAQEQEQRVDTAAARAEVAIADTTALMVAIYSGMLFEDGSLYRFALAQLQRYDAVLLTGLDLPWVADGLQRASSELREPVDALIRSALAAADVRYHVIYGLGGERLASALAAIGDPATSRSAEAQDSGATLARAWNASCEKCGDARCEHRLFTGLF
jgi:nicotinamide riboside kinase